MGICWPWEITLFLLVCLYKSSHPVSSCLPYCMFLSAMFLATLYLAPDHIKPGNTTGNEETPVALYSSFQCGANIAKPDSIPTGVIHAEIV